MDINILRRHAYRNTLWTFFVILFFVLGIWTGKAFASEPKQVKFLDQKPEQYLVARPAITLPTTTTTTAPKPIVKEAPSPVVASAPSVTPQAWHEQCRQWVIEAGVAEVDVDNALWLIGKESGCRVDAHNPSGAHGIPQALPGSKMASAGADWQTNPVTQIRWMVSYVNARYGGWANACAHSRSHNWY